MKKVLLVCLLLSACKISDSTKIDCDAFPNATICNEDEIITSVEEPKSLLPIERAYEYSNGSEFFDSYFSMKLYLTKEQHDFDYYTMYLKLGELYHYLSNRFEDKIQYHYDYTHLTNIRDINENPTQTHYLSTELFDLIKYAINLHTKTNGYFDITIGPVTALWHKARSSCEGFAYNQKLCHIPSKEQLDAAAKYVNIDDIQLNEKEKTISLKPGMSLDLGGITKGYFVEKLANQFIEENVQAFLISAGGNVRTYGSKPEESLYKVGIQDPIKSRGDIINDMINVPGGYSIVSSGDQERSFMKDDVIYHHIINPYTNYPDHYVKQITIVTSNSGYADAISTSTYIMPFEEAQQFIESLPDVEAFWVDLNNQPHMSSGMDKFISKLEE